jgi:hypothetical protein
MNGGPSVANPILYVQVTNETTPFNFTVPNYDGATIRYTKPSATTGLFNYYCKDGTFCDGGAKYPLSFVENWQVAFDFFTGDTISLNFTKVPTPTMLAFYKSYQNELNCKTEAVFPYPCVFQITYLSSYMLANILAALASVTILGSVTLLALRNRKVSDATEKV